MLNKYRATRLTCYSGYVTQAITVNLAPLLFVIFQQKFTLSLAYIALIPLITFLIQIIIDGAAIFFVEKLTYRTLAVSSQVTSFLGLVLLSVLPTLMDPSWGIIIAILIYSSGSALAEVVMSPLAESLPREEGEKSSMTILHSFYSWGQAGVILVSTLLIRLLGNDLWFLLPLIGAVIPFVNTLMFLRVPMPETATHDSEHMVWKMLLKPSFVAAFVLMICAGAAEQVMAQWASLFAETGLGVSKVVGDIVGPCFFAVLMGVGRTGHGLFGERYSMKKLLFILSGFTALCYLITVFAPVPFVSLLGCGLCGLGVSIMWPGMLALCAKSYPGAGASMFAVLALGGDIGCSVGPYLSGLVSDAVSGSSNIASLCERFSLASDQLGLRAGFLAAIIFPLIMLVGVIFLKENKEVTK